MSFAQIILAKYHKIFLANIRAIKLYLEEYDLQIFLMFFESLMINCFQRVMI